MSTNLADCNKPQWQTLGVAMMFAAMPGGLAYLPIREATNDLKQSVNLLADKVVTQQELEWRTARLAEDRARTEANVKDLRNAQVPRKELDRVFDSYDQRSADQQRQMEELKRAKEASTALGA